MKHISILLLCSIALAFFSCSQPVERDILLFYNGDVDIMQNKITNKTNMLFHSTQFDITGFKNTNALEIEKDGKKFTIPIPKETGFYVVNLSNDTIYGSKKSLQPPVIDSADVEKAKYLVDSLQNLLKNNSASSIILLPNNVKKISSNPKNVRAFPPYKEMYGKIESTDDGSMPEIYKVNAKEDVLFELQNYKNIYEPIELKNTK